MVNNDKNTPRPPEPPEFGRRIMFDRAELIGVPLLLSIPLLALFGLFGDASAEITASNPRFEMQVSYPKRIRYKLDERLEVLVRNTSRQPLNRLTVALDQDYLARFSDLNFSTQPSRVTKSAYEVRFDNVQPGETRLVHLEMTGKRFGRHEGRIEALSDDGQLAQAKISTIIFP